MTMILPGLTTTSRRYGWQAKVEEIRSLGLKAVAVFPTPLEKAQRQELYRQLDDSPIEELPFVHIRAEDMDEDELAYLVEHFGTRRFNVHPASRHPLGHDLSRFNPQIFVENMYTDRITEADLAGRGGVCLDVSHLENVRRLYPDEYDLTVDLLKRVPCGCWHVSAVRAEPFEVAGVRQVACHSINDLSEVDYLARYREYLPDIVAIEMENPLARQLEAIERIKSLLRLA